MSDNPRFLPFSLTVVILAWCVGLTTSTARAQPAAADDGVLVRDVVVLLVDAQDSKLNDRRLFESTLPPLARLRRPMAEPEDRNLPSPVGFINFQAGFDTELDVVLAAPGGSFLAGWPSPQFNTKRLVWQEIQLLVNSGGDSPLPRNHWLGPLEEARRLFITAEPNPHRFLLYDVELQRESLLEVSIQQGQYKLNNKGDYPIHDISLFKPTAQGAWRSGWVTRLDSPTDSKTDTADDPNAERDDRPPEDSTRLSLFDDEPSTEDEQQSSRPSPDATPRVVSAPVALGESTITDTDELFAPWQERLAALGLDPREVEVVLSILQRQVVDQTHATIVYRLDPAQHNAILPLEIEPAARRLRVALVVLIGADPELDSTIGALIAQLGDPTWQTRQDAHARLRELGKAAKEKLEAALEDDDLEIKYRAEQLLERIEAPVASP